MENYADLCYLVFGIIDCNKEGNADYLELCVVDLVGFVLWKIMRICVIYLVFGITYKEGGSQTI